MANTTINALTTLTGASLATNDKFLVYDLSANIEKGITGTELKNGVLALAGATGISYSTGTFTPVVSDAATGGNVATGTFYGYYTKIGRQVTVALSLSNIVTTGMTAANDLHIQGLPFVAGSVTGSIYFVGSGMFHTVGFDTDANVFPYVLDNTSYIKFAENKPSAATDYITVSQISSSVGDIYFSLTYFAAS